MATRRRDAGSPLGPTFADMLDGPRRRGQGGQPGQRHKVHEQPKRLQPRLRQGVLSQLRAREREAGRGKAGARRASRTVSRAPLLARSAVLDKQGKPILSAAPLLLGRCQQAGALAPAGKKLHGAGPPTRSLISRARAPAPARLAAAVAGRV